ncbi:PIN domain-containing protein [Candidatus Gottesmanbacteria bacterium]|nr:PIN domain-containing protein [Candidatus Gottesmanbacteria bacterium]
MIFVDTNYFLRYFFKDIPGQYETAKKLFIDGATGKKNLFTSIIVIFEIYWMFTSFYNKTKQEVIDVLNKILKLNFLQLEEKEVIAIAIGIYKRSNLDLEDSYNIAYSKFHNAASIKTFDKKLEKEFLK